MLSNPVVASILVGAASGFLLIPLPGVVDRTVELVSQAAVPLSLIALGMGLAEYRIQEGWRISSTISFLELVLHPCVVYVLARLLALPVLETQVVVVLASLPVGANVYLMSRQFNALGGPVAASLALSTALAAVTTPPVLALTTEAPRRGLRLGQTVDAIVQELHPMRVRRRRTLEHTARLVEQKLLVIGVVNEPAKIARKTLDHLVVLAHSGQECFRAHARIAGAGGVGDEVARLEAFVERMRTRPAGHRLKTRAKRDYDAAAANGRMVSHRSSCAM